MGFWTLAIMAMAVIMYGVITAAKNQQPPVRSVVLSPDVTETDHSFGDPEAKVVLVEFGDFQCPACANYYPIVKQIEANFKDSVRLVFRHFPLTNTHPNAMAASQAAEAAGLQGKFWEMHDLLYENQSDWSSLPSPRNTFMAYAGRLSLNVDRFQKDMDSEAVTAAIRFGVESGNRSAILGTPTFFMNGQKIQTPSGYEPFRDILVSAGAFEKK